MLTKQKLNNLPKLLNTPYCVHCIGWLYLLNAEIKSDFRAILLQLFFLIFQKLFHIMLLVADTDITTEALLSTFASPWLQDKE